nr:oligosaccharide flippase family protein [Bacillus sp. FJAT-49711]
MTGTTIAQALPIAASPILTRIFTPDDFGILALFLSITSIIGVMITGRYELAIMLPKEDKEAVNLVALSITIAAGISLFLLTLIIIFGEQISALLGNSQIYPWLFFVPLSLFLTGIFQAFNYWSNRKLQYKRIANATISKSTTTAGMNIGIGVMQSGAAGLVLGNVLGQLAATVQLVVKSIKKGKISFSYVTLKEMTLLAKKYDRFPKVSIWSAMLNTASLQLPVFVLSTGFSSAIVGFFSLSQRVLSIPMSVLGSAFGQVFFQTSTKLKEEDPKGLTQVTYRSYKYMLLIGVIPISIIFGFGDIIFSFVFGKEWQIAGEYARILSVWLLLVFISSPLALLYTVMNREGTLFLFNLSMFVSRAIVLLFGIFYFKDAYITIILFSVISSLFYLWNNIYILKLVNISMWRSLLNTVFVMTVALCIISVFRYLFLNTVW